MSNSANFPETARLSSLLQGWRDDTVSFLRHDAPKLLLIIVGAFVLVWLLRLVTHRAAKLQEKRLLPGLRAQQVRTLASVINSVGVVVILFWAILQTLPLLGLTLGPLLASAGIAGLAIGFGAQTLVRDVINGFFVLMEDQFNLGDTIRVAGVKGTVEGMSLRRTVLRDDDGTVHMVPNSQITIVSNMTRDWAQIPLRVTVAYNEDSARVVGLLQQVAEDVRHDPSFADDIVADIQVPGIDRIGNGEAEYLMLVKTRPNRQYVVGRELRRRIKESFQKNNIQPGAPGRVFVVDQGLGPQAALFSGVNEILRHRETGTIHGNMSLANLGISETALGVAALGMATLRESKQRNRKQRYKSPKYRFKSASGVFALRARTAATVSQVGKYTSGRDNAG